MTARKCVFLDRDGVINHDPGDYTYTPDDIVLEAGAAKALNDLKKAGFLLVVVTNQAGIAKKIYTLADVALCHEKIQRESSGAIDAFYTAPHHPDHDTASLGRKPGSLLFEKAVARFGIDVSQSWMLGDKERDLIPAKRIGVPRLVFIGSTPETPTVANFVAASLHEAVEQYILPSA